MNEDQHIDSEPIDQELLRQLERATAPVFLEQETSSVQETGSDNDIVDDEAVDSETRSLRQTWLAFGSLLDAAQSPPSTAIAVELPPRQTAAKWWTVSQIWSGGTQSSQSRMAWTRTIGQAGSR